jgi:hypothetical protein
VATQKTPRRRKFGTLRTMRSGRVQASYVYDDGRRYFATHTYDNRTDAEGWLANERKLIELGEWSPPEPDTARAGRCLLPLGRRSSPESTGTPRCSPATSAASTAITRPRSDLMPAQRQTRQPDRLLEDNRRHGLSI